MQRGMFALAGPNSRMPLCNLLECRWTFLQNFIMTTFDNNLNKSMRTAVGVYHDDVHVATVFVNPNTIDKMLTQAYMLSQNNNACGGWYNTKLVESNVSYARSSKLTDIFEIDNMKYVAQSDSSDSDLNWRAVDWPDYTLEELEKEKQLADMAESFKKVYV